MMSIELAPSGGWQGSKGSVVKVWSYRQLSIEVGPSPSNIVSGGGLRVVGFKGFLSKDPGVHY